MSSQGDSSDCCSDNEGPMSETRENPQSDTDDVTDQHEHVDNDMKASIWFFEGTFVLDLDTNEWTEDEIRGILPRDDLVPRVEAHFRTDYFKKPPVPIHYMEIGIDFSKASLGGCTFTAPISGLLQAQSACAGTWNSWLQCPGSIEFIPYTDHELLELLRRRVEGWDIVARLGRRRRFVVQGRAWKFSATLVVPIPADADDYVDRAKEAFVATGGPRTLPTVLQYMTVLADLRSPISGATGLVSIPIKGYIQCRQCDSIRWLNWQPTFDYDVVHMGLASNAEFLADMAGLNSPSSSMFEIYTTGTLGLNNAGRMDKATRASASLAFPFKLPRQAAPPELCACVQDRAERAAASGTAASTTSSSSSGRPRKSQASAHCSGGGKPRYDDRDAFMRIFGRRRRRTQRPKGNGGDPDPLLNPRNEAHRRGCVRHRAHACTHARTHEQMNER
jgi:hypothetical protein